MSLLYLATLAAIIVNPRLACDTVCRIRCEIYLYESNCVTSTYFILVIIYFDPLGVDFYISISLQLGDEDLSLRHFDTVFVLFQCLQLLASKKTA